MLRNNTIINKESFTPFDSTRLADTINHDLKSIPLDQMCMATHNYDIMFIEKVLNAIELQADIDRFVALLKIRWKIDVSNNRMEVVKLNTETKLYEPYHPQFENDVDAIAEKIRQKRELELSLKKLLEEWNEVRHEMSSTTTQANMPSEISQTSLPTFSSDESVIYHLDDLPTDVQNQILITDDKVYSDFVTTMRGPVKSWIDKRRLQDWNVVRFVCRLRGIVTRKCSLSIFGKLLERIGLGNQENNMKQRSDANDKNALVAYDDLTNRNPKYNYLRKDGSDVEELLSDVIKALAA